MNGIQEVSIPIGSTKIPNNINDLMDTCAARNFQRKVIKSYKEKSTVKGSNSQLGVDALRQVARPPEARSPKEPACKALKAITDGCEWSFL